MSGDARVRQARLVPRGIFGRRVCGALKRPGNRGKRAERTLTPPARRLSPGIILRITLLHLTMTDCGGESERTRRQEV